jgi:Asp-tRNA(Asn)/Glu-tRNA(Gln) amidotransferase C subunit
MRTEKGMKKSGEQLTTGTLRAAARLAGMELTPRELKALAATLRDYQGLLARLDEVDVGETDPAFILPMKTE